MCVRVQFLSSGKRGVRLGLVVEGEGGRLGLELTTTHPLQYRGLELDRQETSATEVCKSSLSFYRLVLLWPLLHPF